MVLAMAVLLLQFPAFPSASDATQPSPKSNIAVETAKAAPDAKKTLPAAVTPAAAPKAVAPPVADQRSAASNAVLADARMSDVYLPPPAAFRPKIEPMEHSSRLWFALSAAQHGSAVFDAWSTRRAIAQGRVETDPLMRQFAHSAAIYGAIQVIPFGLDYVGRRMERSTGWTRHVWWVPQSLATAAFVFSGSYNVAHTR